ncbi:cytidine deaminase [Algibacter lectus]|uniref:Cytidine deaminase n=1 Tax=Algibacter lectus TaxID=221126 RepID=A0A090VCA7_9FLAO|nr:cytidine deaminase [Algibacter lectus]
MKEVKIESTLYVYDDLNETPDDVVALMAKAIEARDKAYAPYSKFHVALPYFWIIMK